MGVTLYNALRQRGPKHPLAQAGNLPEVPHCFTMITGDTMSLKHRQLMEESLDGTAVYVCVKMYSRDLNLSQPPFKVASMAQITAVHPAIPRGVHSAVELSASQIDTFSRLAELAEKYGMAKAAKALQELVLVRRYDVHPLEFLRQARRVFCPEPEGFAQLPYLPQSCWRLMAKMHQ